MLSCPLSCGITELVEHNTPNNNSEEDSTEEEFETIYEFNCGNTIEGRFVKAPSSDWTSSTSTTEVHSKQ